MDKKLEFAMDVRTVLDLLKKEMMPAMGCTEPAAAALCGAKAHELLGEGRLAGLSISASRDMVKNAMGVGIPSSPMKGLGVAVALGYAVGSTEKGLSILSSLTEKQVDEARTIASELEIVHEVPPLYVCVSARSVDGRTAKAAISGEHDRFCHLERDGEVLLSLPLDPAEDRGDDEDILRDLTFEEVIDFANSVDVEELGFVRDAIRTNYEIAKFSIEGKFGLEVGKTMMEGIGDPLTSLKDAFSKGAALAAAGSDARMSGCPMPVIINSGSGNQGITVTVPVKVVADYLKCPEDRAVRAVCISELVGLILTARKNRLSALCGVFTAAIGTACAWGYLLGGDSRMMNMALNTMVGNLSGIICDGAKNTCALKIYSSLECASMSVRLALKGLSPGSESGIVGGRISETIDNLSRLCNEGMKATDETVMSIMINKCNN